LWEYAACVARGKADNAPVTSSESSPPPALADSPATPLPDPASLRSAWRWWHAVAIGLLVALAQAWLIHDYPMARTEAHRVVTTLQMLERGDFLMPALWGHPYLAKPPLIYWLAAPVVTVLGPEMWAFRLVTLTGTALLAGVLAGVGRKWFGTAGGWAAGLSLLALIPLWVPTRTVDIQQTNTVAATLSAIALLQLGFGPPGRRWLWLLFGGVAITATMMAKGPAGAPTIFGAILGASLLVRQWRWALRPGVLAIVIIGPLVLITWYILARQAGMQTGLPVQSDGLSEVGDKLTAYQFQRLFKVLTNPLVVFVATLPVSLAPLVAWRWGWLWPESASDAGAAPAQQQATHHHAIQRRMLKAVVGAVLGAVVISVLALLYRPRYLHHFLPLMCLVAGAIAQRWAEGGLSDIMRLRVRQTLTVCCIVWPIIATVLVVVAWDREGQRVAMVCWLVALWLVAVVSVVLWVQRNLRPALVGVVLTLVLTSVVFAYHHQRARTRKSSVEAARIVRDTVGGGPIGVIRMIPDKPGLLHMIGAPVLRLDDALRQPGTWVLVDDREWAGLLEDSRVTLTEPLVIKTPGLDVRLAQAVKFEPAAGSGDTVTSKPGPDGASAPGRPGAARPGPESRPDERVPR